MSDSFTGAPNSDSARSTEPASPPVALRIVVFAMGLLRLPDQQQAVARSGNGTAHEDEVALGVDLLDPKLLDRHLLVAHVTGHTRALPDPSRICAGADGPRRAMVVGAVGLRASPEVMAGDDAGEAVALADAGDVDQLAGLEDIDADLLADLERICLVDTDLAHVLEVLLVLGQVLQLAGHGLRRATRAAGAELDGGITVLLGGADARHRVRGSLDHAHGDDAAVVGEEPGHAQLATDDACHHILISMSTPAASDSRISASTVFVDGSMMSIRRLWVRISNCSRPSLWTKGPRMTVYFSIRVGSGTGPATSAPVRCAVSTICSADWSSSLWSYALSRMRMRCLAITASR